MLSPNQVDAYCGGGEHYARTTAIQSIVTSTDDRLEDIPVPSAAAIARIVRSQGGVIAHWDAQLLVLPDVARQLGYPGPDVTLGDAAIGNRLVDANSRRIYLTFILPDGSRKTYALRANDMQNVCSEARLSA
jgi:hypothetical protein